MDDKRYGWLRSAPTDERIVEAKELIPLLDEMQDELTGAMQYFMDVQLLLRRRYSHHKSLIAFVRRYEKLIRPFTLDLHDIRAKYRQRIADYEHAYGAVEAKPIRGLTPFTMAFSDLMDDEREKVIEDLLFDE